ncbi:MAG TPA: GNAT family N-acetyltransferase [Bacillota bacterium]|nr:GNAT family N-acetyltransferase [Bacillota bacterium]
MSNLRLIVPVVQLRSQYLEMYHDWGTTGERVVPMSLQRDPTDFGAMVNNLWNASQGIGLPAAFVPCSTYWMVNEADKILGVVDIRHRLTPTLRQWGGHIGYGIRPGERRKGYATQLLQLALDRAQTLGIEKVLITCDKENIGSAKVIMKNGGKLEDEAMVDGVIIQRYWIDLSQGHGMGNAQNGRG